MSLQTQKTKTSWSKTLIILSVLCITSLISNPIAAQENFTVQGNVSSEIEPLSDVSIYLKGSKTGTVSKTNGNFTFPIKLKTGDVLIFSYLGFEKQSVVISKNNTNLTIVLKEEPLDVLSALNSNKPYRSKRRKN